MIEVHLMDIIWHGHSCFELVSGGYSKINLFGEEMVTSCGVAARALAALAGAGIEIVLITTSDLDISLLIRQQDEDTALDALHKAFAV